MVETDVIVIGGGVLGISLAYHLGKRGTSVVLLEREIVPAMHASGKNAGMLRALYRHPQLTEWATQSLALWPEEVTRRFFQHTGSLVIGRQAPGHHDNLFIERNYTDASGTTSPAVYTPSDGLLDSPAYVNYLYALCDSTKVTRKLSTCAIDVEFLNSEWRVRCTSGSQMSEEQMRAPVLVNAGGAWINDTLARHLSSLQVDVRAYARHLLLVENWPNNWMPQDDIGFFWEENAGWYMRRWDSDSRLVSICDEVPAVPETFVPSPSIAEETAEKLLCALPTFAEQLRIGTSWHCFRTYTEDQLPIFGADPDNSSLYWLAAFGGFGMSTGFAAASDLAEEIAGVRSTASKEFLASRCRLNKINKKRATA